MRVYCPGCDAKLKVEEEDLDEKIDCPKCDKRFRLSNAEEVEAPRPKKRNSKSDKARAFPLLPVLLGGGGFLFVVVVAVIVVALNAGNDNAKPIIVAQNQPKLQFEPIRPNGGTQPANPVPSGPPSTRPNTGGVATRPITPDTKKSETPVSALDLLFAKEVNASPPPKFRAALLEKEKESQPLTVPSFFSLRLARQPAKAQPAKITKLTLDEVKAATVFIKVEAGDLSSSGSGFYIGAEGDSALVATNHHVIDSAMSSKRFGDEKGSEKPPVIRCVFNSGVPGQEWESVAKVTAIDATADLAVLRLVTPKQLPKPINPWGMPKLTETMDVRICGFPFGAQLATSTDNPNISVNTGTISSLRLNKSGALEQVQINGSLNPGNSGGPIVDKDGRLTGIAVATISGSGLGFAVPVDELVGLLEGKILLTEFLPLGLEAGKAKFKVLLPIMDPRAQVRAVYLRYWAGTGARPVGVKDAKIGYKPIVTPEPQVNMILPNSTSSLTVMTGDMILPSDATEVIVQLATENVEGLVASSPPVAFKLTKKDLENGSDARPFNEVFKPNAAKEGQTVVVRARILGLETSRLATQVILVADTNLKLPSQYIFLSDRATASRLDEVDPSDQPKEVRLTCLIGSPDGRGVTAVRVTRADFLEEGDTVCHSTAEAETTNPLSSLNREPAKQAGRKLALVANAVPMTRQTADSDVLRVLFDSFRRPRNLDFVMVKGLNEKIAAAKLKTNGIYKVRLAATVGDKLNEADQSMKVTVSKLEILDPKDDSVIKTIE